MLSCSSNSFICTAVQRGMPACTQNTLPSTIAATGRWSKQYLRSGGVPSACRFARPVGKAAADALRATPDAKRNLVGWLKTSKFVRFGVHGIKLPSWHGILTVSYGIPTVSRGTVSGGG